MFNLLLVEHAGHGRMPDYVLARESRNLDVAVPSLEQRYGEFLRRLELDAGCVVLSADDREAIRQAGSLLEAHAILSRAGRIVPFALFERAVWRDAGDRDLVGLRNAECALRFAARDRPHRPIGGRSDSAAAAA